jgi:glucose-1-phosphatase
MENIRNIIFDLGGIFLNIDFARTRQAFTDLGIPNFDALYTQHHASSLIQDLEVGAVTPEEFHQRLVGETGVPLSYDQVEAAWNALLLDFPPERLEWLEEVGKKYRTFLFSNTNAIHYKAFKDSFYRQWGKDFDSYFEKAYYSHLIGLRKPTPESFLYILSEQNLKPEETLFIDDTLKNIEGAREVGLQTLHIVHPMTVLDSGL